VDKLANVDAGQTITVQEGKGIVGSRPYGAGKVSAPSAVKAK